jgi:hypothetical protein
MTKKRWSHFFYKLFTIQKHGHFLVEKFFFALEYMLNVANEPVLAEKSLKTLFLKIHQNLFF